MLLNGSVLIIILAGLMNGSFVIPAKYVKSFSNEKVWLFHSIIGLAIIPWILLALILPYVFHNYLLLPSSILLFIIFSGIIFGLGQVCFAYAIEAVGIALSFTINLGIGVVIGSLFVIFYRNVFFTIQGYLVTLAVLLILASLVIYYYAGKRKQQHPKILDVDHSHYHTGWALASLAGFASGLQNITFVIVAFHAKTEFQMNNSFWVWPPFLLAAAVVMLIGFAYRIKKKNVKKQTAITGSLMVKNIFLITLMGLFFTGSLALYSRGMNQLSHPQQIIGWPAFMVSIILASQTWGWLYKESRSFTKKNKLYRFFSLLLLLIAIVLLAIEA